MKTTWHDGAKTDARPVALITMATGYVGPALARSLATHVHDLVLHGSSASADTMVGVEVAFADQVPELEALGASVHTVTDVDLATADGNQALVVNALVRFGRVDSACLVTGRSSFAPAVGLEHAQGIMGRHRPRTARRDRSAGADAQARHDGRTRRVHLGAARRQEPVPDRSVLQLQRGLEHLAAAGASPETRSPVCVSNNARIADRHATRAATALLCVQQRTNRSLSLTQSA